MKKTILGLTLITTLVLVLGLTSVVSADSGDPTPHPARCSFVDNVFKTGGCGFGRSNEAGLNDGLLHDYMLEAFSEKLGVSVSELESRLEAGERMSDIAIAEGMTLEDFRTWMLDARSQAIDLALADGAITEEQAEWMNSRGGMMFGGAGRSQGFGMMGPSGRMGGFGGFQTCPNLP